MSDINIFKLDGKPLEKFIETIGNWWSDKRRPKQIRAEADSKAYEIRVIEKAKSDAKIQSAEQELEFNERMQQRITNQEISRQINIDAIIKETADQLNGKTVNEEPVSKDWTTRFFNIAQDVSEEEMQNLWARVLAGEIQKPNSFSFRTLELLRNLTLQEANTFLKLANLVLIENEDSLIPYDYRMQAFEGNLNTRDRLLLKEVGLLGSTVVLFTGHVTTDQVDPYKYSIRYIDVIIEFQVESTVNIDIKFLALTSVSIQLLKIVKPKFNFGYLKAIINALERNVSNINLYKVIEGKNIQTSLLDLEMQS